MKSLHTRLLTCAAVALALPLCAATYNDPSADGALVGSGGGILDITGVEVNNTATDLIFKISLAGDPVATDWGKYMIGFDTAPGGDTAGNGWGRPISMSSGMDYWVGSWADFGTGAEFRSYSGSWSLPLSNPAITVGTDSITLQFPFAQLGLSIGNSFDFDVYTSGGGGSDGAIDALSNPNQTIANWSDPYDSGQLVSGYTIVPEPTSLSLLGLGALLLWRRALRSRN